MPQVEPPVPRPRIASAVAVSGRKQPLSSAVVVARRSSGEDRCDFMGVGVISRDWDAFTHHHTEPPHHTPPCHRSDAGTLAPRDSGGWPRRPSVASAWRPRPRPSREPNALGSAASATLRSRTRWKPLPKADGGQDGATKKPRNARASVIVTGTTGGLEAPPCLPQRSATSVRGTFTVVEVTPFAYSVPHPCLA